VGVVDVHAVQTAVYVQGRRHQKPQARVDVARVWEEGRQCQTRPFAIVFVEVSCDPDGGESCRRTWLGSVVGGGEKRESLCAACLLACVLRGREAWMIACMHKGHTSKKDTLGGGEQLF
jgi:hypothetical protein